MVPTTKNCTVPDQTFDYRGIHLPVRSGTEAIRTVVYVQFGRKIIYRSEYCRISRASVWLAIFQKGGNGIIILMSDAALAQPDPDGGVIASPTLVHFFGSILSRIDGL